MKLEAGKWYKDRCGSRWHVDYAGGAYACGHSDSESVCTWRTDNGYDLFADGSALDLIAEWTDAPAVGSSEWANSLPEGTKVRFSGWHKRDWIQRKGNRWFYPNGAPFGSLPNELEWSLYTEPKLRPWKPEEVPLGAWMREKNGGLPSLIVGVTSNNLGRGHGCLINFPYSLEHYEHSIDNGKTWLPCGVEE